MLYTIIMQILKILKENNYEKKNHKTKMRQKDSVILTTFRDYLFYYLASLCESIEQRRSI